VSSATFVLTTDPGQVPLQLQGIFRDWPPYTSFALGKEQGRGEDGNWFASIDIKDMVHAQPLDSLQQPVDLRIAVGVAAPDHAAAATMLPKLDIRGTLRFLLLQVRKGGLSFGAGDTPVERTRGVAVVSGEVDLHFVGTAKTTNELDWIAIAENQKQPSGRKSCSFTHGGVAFVRFYDADVGLFDRRSGKKLKSTVLHQPAKCPTFTVVDQEGWAHSSVPTQDVLSWTERQLEQASR